MNVSTSGDGDQLLAALEALANPHRLRILAALHEGANYTSQLARELLLSRPLLHMHLKKLEAVELIRGESTVAEDGKARRYYEPTQFAITLTPDSVHQAAQTLSEQPGGSAQK